MKRKLLIGTTNQHKLEQILFALADSPFEILSLNDIEQELEDPEETADTLEGNALLKAKYYAQKTGLMTLADDTGLFIDALGGWPGVKTLRDVEGETIGEKRKTILKKMEGVPEANRGAYFQQALALYDPETDEAHISFGKTEGKILEQEVTDNIVINFGYNTLFYLEELQKTFAECSEEELQQYSQRGKALQKMEYHFTNSFGERSMMVVVGIVIQNGKILMNRRNDPHNPKYHNKWEFPGGKVDVGETMTNAIVREVEEECGFPVTMKQMIPQVYEVLRTGSFGTVKLYINMFLCVPIDRQPEELSVDNTKEVLDSRWFELESIYKEELVGENQQMIKEVEPYIQEFIETN